MTQLLNFPFKNQLDLDGIPEAHHQVNRISISTWCRSMLKRSDLPDNDEEHTLLNLLSYDPCHIDAIIRESGLSANTVSATLTMMELKGMVKHIGGMQYVLAR